MTAVILVELAIAALVGVAFVLLYALRSRWRSTAVGRHMMVFALVTTGEAASLFALGLGAPVPLWVFAVGYGLTDFLVIQRLYLLIKAQQSG
jgi:hypothetical protein